MKRFLALALSVLLAVTVIPFGTFAVSAQTSADFTYSVVDGVLTIEPTSGSTNVAIPDYNLRNPAPWGKDITSAVIKEGITRIGQNAFEHCGSLTSVQLPSSLLTIGYCAFNCAGIKELELNENLVSIEGSAFSACSQLASVKFPNTLTKISDYAFQSCISLKSVTLPDSLTEMGTYVFDSCTLLGSVTLSASVKSVPDYTFYKCTSLKSITIPEGITKIGRNAFLGCTSLESVSLPKTLELIAENPFGNCTSLKTVTVANENTAFAFMDNSLVNKSAKTLVAATKNSVIPNDGSVTFIGENAFRGQKITAINIPEKIVAVGEGAFYDCDNLETVNIGNGVKTICYSAFYRCAALTEINIPDNVTAIGDNAFAYCSKLSKITLSEKLTQLSEGIFTECQALKSVKIPDSVTVIGEKAFFKCSELENVTISKNVKIIDWKAFAECTSLKSVSLPNGISNVNARVFNGCTSLSSVTLPESIKTICKEAFEDCAALKNITLPKNLEKIEEEAFLNSGLEKIVLPKSLKTLECDAFRSCGDLSSISVLSENLSIAEDVFKNTAYYNNTENWEDGVLYVGNLLVSGENYTGGNNSGAYSVKQGTVAIANRAFRDNDYITSLTVPDSIKYIGKQAFNYCKNLNSISLPDVVFEYSAEAFESCGYIVNEDNEEKDKSALYIGKHLIYVNDSYYPDGSDTSETLTDFTVKEGTLTVADGAFEWTDNITELTLPESVGYIGAGNFTQYLTLDRLNIAATNKNYKLSGNCLIDLNRKSLIKAFDGAVIPSDGSVTEIAQNALYDIKDTTVTVPEGVTVIRQTAFSDTVKNIVLPKSLTYIEGNAFKETDDNAVFYVQPDSFAETYLKYNGYIFSNDTPDSLRFSAACSDGFKYTFIGDKMLVSGYGTLAGYGYFADKITEIAVAEGVNAISWYGFSDYPKLEKLILPSSIVYVGNNAISGEATPIIYSCIGSSAENWAKSQKYSYVALCNDHILNLAATNKSATCANEGEGYYMCNDCYYKVMGVIEKSTSHTGKTKVENKKAATCTAAGYTGDTVCATCGETLKKGTSVAKKAHTLKTTVTKATLTKNGKTVKACTVCKKTVSTVNIAKVNKFTLSKTKYVYDGKAKKPTVTVKDANGKKLTLNKDYTVAYSANKYVGKASVKITLKGNYSGTKTLYFTISPKAATLKSVTGGKKQVTVKWNKQATQTSGYQIQYSTSSAFKNAKTVTVTSNKTTSKTVKNLNAGKKYYVRVRTYKTVKNTKYYSAWSAKKSATAKK